MQDRSQASCGSRVLRRTAGLHAHKLKCIDPARAPFLEQHFRRNVVRGAHCGVRKLAPICVPTLPWPLTLQVARGRRRAVVCQRLRLRDDRHLIARYGFAKTKVRELHVPRTAEK